MALRNLWLLLLLTTRVKLVLVMDASQCGNDRPRFGVHEVS
jgi:hypothetical protein